MNAEYFVINDGGQWQKIKNFCAVPPNVNRSVFPKAFVVKAVNLRNLSALVISSDKCDSVSVPNLERQQK